MASFSSSGRYYFVITVLTLILHVQTSLGAPVPPNCEYLPTCFPTYQHGSCSPSRSANTRISTTDPSVSICLHIPDANIFHPDGHDKPCILDPTGAGAGTGAEPPPAQALLETHVHHPGPRTRGLWKRPLGNPTMKSAGAKSDSTTTTARDLLGDGGIWIRPAGNPTC